MYGKWIRGKAVVMKGLKYEEEKTCEQFIGVLKT